MLSDAEKAFFGMDDVTLPTDVNVVQATTQTKPAEVVQYAKPRRVVDVAPGESDEDATVRSQGLTPPKASAPAAQPPPAEKPTCGACGTALTAENGSQLRDGGWKHIGCPAENPEGVSRRRGRPPGSKNAPKPESAQGGRVDPVLDASRVPSALVDAGSIPAPLVEAAKNERVFLGPSAPMRAPTTEEAASLRAPAAPVLTVSVVVELGPATTALLARLLSR